MDRPHYFAFYPADFANDIKVESMSTLQVGAYILLLCKAWQSDPPATLPSDDAILARLARVELAVWLEIKSVVLDAFRISADGRLLNKRLRAEYDKASRLIRDKSKAGQKAAKTRWGDNRRITDALRRQSERNANQNQNQNQISSVPSELTGGTPADVPKSSNGKKPASGPHHDSRRLFDELWKAKYGENRPANYGKDGAALKWMLEQVEGDTSKLHAIFVRFLADDDKFYAAGDRHDLSKLRQHFARWLVEAKSSSGGPPKRTIPGVHENDVDCVVTIRAKYRRQDSTREEAIAALRRINPNYGEEVLDVA